MKLAEIRGEKAIEVLADLIDPIRELASDKVFIAKLTADKLDGIKYLLKSHSKTIITILAILEGEDPDIYQPNLLSLPVALLDFFNDPTVADLFGLQSQTTDKTSSGSAMENTEASEA